jgi:hypothetical protein
MKCEEVSARIDLCVDGNMEFAEAAAFKEHLASCEACEALRAGRAALRARIRAATRDVEIPFALGDRIRFAIAKEIRSSSHGWTGMLSAVAATVFAVVGGVYYYPVYYPMLFPQAPPPVSPGEAYVRQVATLVPPIMQVGVSQHVHCGVLRQYPEKPPSLLELAHAPGANAGLINAVESHLPDQCRVVMAHKCDYKGRSYIHVIARGGGNLLSLLITKRLEGDEFDKDLQAVQIELDTPIYSAEVQNYAIHAFDASGNLVYLVSDFDASENLRMLQGMTDEVRAALL